MLLKPHKPASAQKKEDREKRKYEYAICRIRRKGCQARDETLGSGFFVRNLIIPGFAFHFCLVASEKYIPGDDFETYYLEFKQFESTELERIELNEIASSDRSDVYRTLDLICIRINVDRIKKKTFYKDSSRSFKVVTERLGSYENLFCYFVDDSQAKSLVKQVRIELNSRKGFQILDGVDTYSTYNQFTQGKLDGGVILKRIEGELQVVGVLQFTNEGTISPVFFPLPSEGKGKMPLSQCATEIENGRAASGSEMVEEEGQDSGIDLTLGNQHSSESNQAERKMPPNHFATDGGGASENDLVIEGQRDLERSLTVGNQHSLQSSQGSSSGSEGSSWMSYLKSWIPFWNNSDSCSGNGDLSLKAILNYPYDISINPCRTPLQGGGPCTFKLIPDLPSDITSGTAKFADLGFVDLNGVKNSTNCLVGERIPAAREEGSVTVIVNGKSDKTGNCADLGQTQIYYYHKQKDVFRDLVMNQSQLHDFLEELAKENAKSSRDKGSKSSSSGSMDSGNPLFALQCLVLLVYTAAETDVREFIELIFNSSAGRVVFNAYRHTPPLPEDIARAFGHKDTAQYLESLSKRLSEDLSVHEEQLQESHIQELAEAVKNQLTEGRQEQPSREPTEGEEEQPPGESKEAREKQPSGKPAKGGQEQPPREPAEEEEESLKEPAGGEEQPLKEPAGGEEQPRKEPAGGEEQSLKEPAGEEEQPLKEPAGGEEQSLKEPAGGEEQPLKEPAAGEEQPLKEPAGGEEQSLKEPAKGEKQPLKEPAGGEEQPLKELAGGEEQPRKETAGGEEQSPGGPAGGEKEQKSWFEKGDHTSALQSKLQALDMRRKVLGEEHSDTAKSYNSVGITQRSLGDITSALHSSQRVLDIIRTLFGEEHSDTAQSYDSVGITQHSLGDLTSALHSSQRALDIRRKLFGEEHSDTAQSYHSVGLTQHSLGDLTSALHSSQRALDIRRKLFGEEHSDTAESYDSLGATQHSLGDLTLALHSSQRALDIRRKLFGEQHSDTAQSYDSVGITHHSLGDLKSALDSKQRALDIRRKLFGEEHSDTAQSYDSIGVTQHSLGDLTSALHSKQQALAIRRKLFGEEHSDTAQSYDSVGATLHSLGELTSALHSSQRALDIRRKLFGKEHSDTAQSYDSVGATQHSSGELTSALHSKQQALDIR
ncbi:uncharacterized protein LOC111344921 [Stylophora pistillata]|uniref:uncharacterized protein LOC111344921 n=1 Tax=Stylophora pistillata TaxID=50429 RepID=UPI000C048A5A|nr:uncharacterized protein LOC111344921 [Stylophora pistillata]